MCCKDCCTCEGPHRMIAMGEIPDFTSIESIRSYNPYGFLDGLDLGCLDPRDDLYTIVAVCRRAVEKNLEGSFELFGCRMTRETAEYFANTAQMYADYYRES